MHSVTAIVDLNLSRSYLQCMCSAADCRLGQKHVQWPDKIKLQDDSSADKDVDGWWTLHVNRSIPDDSSCVIASISSYRKHANSNTTSSSAIP